MNLDFTFSAGNLLTILAMVVSIVGGYWKIKRDMDRRPNYDKVEDMIKKYSMQRDETEELIEKELKKYAYPNIKGEILEQKLQQIVISIEKFETMVKEEFKRFHQNSNIGNK